MKAMSVKYAGGTFLLGLLMTLPVFARAGTSKVVISFPTGHEIYFTSSEDGPAMSEGSAIITVSGRR